MSPEYEIPTQLDEEHAFEAVNVLKRALFDMQAGLVWNTDDGDTCMARPLLENDIDYATLGDMPLWQVYEMFNAWQILQFGKPDINGDAILHDYFIIPGRPLEVSQFELPYEAYGEYIDRYIDDVLDESQRSNFFRSVLTVVQKEAETRKQLGISNLVLLEHHAILDNILLPLAKKGRETFDTRMEARMNMTPDEIRWEKMQKYRIILGSAETDKTGGPKWWGITQGSQLHAVRASSPEEATVILEEKQGLPMFPVFFIDEYPEDVFETFEEKFEDRAVIRLIPWSHTEWPDDPMNMTDEQREAFDRLKRD